MSTVLKKQDISGGEQDLSPELTTSAQHATAGGVGAGAGGVGTTHSQPRYRRVANAECQELTTPEYILVEWLFPRLLLKKPAPDGGWMFGTYCCCGSASLHRSIRVGARRTKNKTDGCMPASHQNKI